MQHSTSEKQGFTVTGYIVNNRSYIHAQRGFYIYILRASTFSYSTSCPIISRKTMSIWTNILSTTDSITRRRNTAITIRTPENMEAIQ